MNDAPLVGSDLPNVATRIFDHSAAIAVGQVLWLLERYGAGIQSTLVRRVDVVDIEIEKCGHLIARANAAYHNERVTNPDHGRAVFAEVSRRVQRLFEKLDEFGWVLNYDPRGQAVPTFGD
jgi:hypothetical protein